MKPREQIRYTASFGRGSLRGIAHNRHSLLASPSRRILECDPLEAEPLEERLNFVHLLRHRVPSGAVASVENHHDKSTWNVKAFDQLDHARFGEGPHPKRGKTRIAHIWFQQCDRIPSLETNHQVRFRLLPRRGRGTRFGRATRNEYGSFDKKDQKDKFPQALYDCSTRVIFASRLSGFSIIPPPRDSRKQ